MEENDSIDLRKYLAAIRKYKIWYIVSFVILMGLATTYHFTHMDLYGTYATVLIEDEEDNSSSGALRSIGGGLAAMARSFSIGGLGKSSVDNELLIMQSHNLLMRTIRQLNLNVNYTERKFLKKENLYDCSPIAVSCADSLLDTISKGIRLNVKIHKDGKADIKAERPRFRFFGINLCEMKNVTLPATVKTIYGDFQVFKTKDFIAGEEREITVSLSNPEAIANGFSTFLEIDYSTKKADGISLFYKATNKQYGKDLLNNLMNNYNNIRLDRKNERAEQMVKFYDEQIAALNSQLSQAETRFEDFQNKNKVIIPETEAEYLYVSDKEAEQSLVELRNQISAYDLILQVINDPNRKYALLPNADEATAVEEYNKMILEKQKMETSAHESNPALNALKQQIDAMREVVGESVGILKKSTQNAIKNIEGYKGKNKSILNKVPEYQREYINLARDKELMNELYLFLIQKRYSSAMSLTMDQPRGFVIDPAYCDIKPLKTKSMIAFGVCFFMALIIPTVFAIYKANRKPQDDAPSPENDSNSEE